MRAFCAVCQTETEHKHYLDHNGEHVLECQAPTKLVRACTHCVSELDHRTNDAGETVHGNEEYRHHELDPKHIASEPYDGTCKAFIKLPATASMDDVIAHVDAHKIANDRRNAPVPACIHYFPEVAPHIGDSVCVRCGKTHSEVFNS